MPDQKSKGWEFTDIAGLDLESFASADGGDATAFDKATPLVAAFEGGLQVRQVDGLSLDLPTADGAGKKPEQPVAIPLSVAAERYPELVDEHLGSTVPAENRFVARNDSEWAGGAFVYVPAGQRFDAPVELTAVQAQAGSALNWRTLIVLEEGAEAEVWEQYLSAGEEEALFNTVVELVVGPGASLRFASGQNLSESSWIFGSQRAVIDRDATLDWITLGFGSAKGKVRMETKLAGQGANAKVTGAYAGHNSQHLDFDTRQEHAAPNTTSDLAFRGVLTDSATAVWRGMIRVDKGAQKTDAFQESRNLLLSKKAHADAIPGLEIEADDVRCTHAAAVAQVDAEQLFYLRSRGLPDEGAKRLVIEGFMQELVERLTEGQVGNALSAALELRLEEILD